MPNDNLDQDQFEENSEGSGVVDEYGVLEDLINSFSKLNSLVNEDKSANLSVVGSNVTTEDSGGKINNFIQSIIDKIDDSKSGIYEHFCRHC